MFRRSLHWVIKHRYATIACMVLLLVLSAWSFKFIPKYSYLHWTSNILP